MPGLNALAGFIFSIISYRYGNVKFHDSFYQANVMILGYDFSKYSSATAAAAVYGAVNLWSTYALYFTFGPLLSRIKRETVKAELAGGHPPGITDLLVSSRRDLRFRPPFVFYQHSADVTDL
jgi:hypothetical protein